MVRAIRGVLITCDPPVKAIIKRMHARDQDVIIEDLDETHLLIQENKLAAVQQEIRNVRACASFLRPPFSSCRVMVPSSQYQDADMP